MANSRIPGPINVTDGWIPSRTPGPLGVNDQGDPNVCTLLGDSPGPLGFLDYADPSLPFLLRDHIHPMSYGRTATGLALSLALNQKIPNPDALSKSGNITAEQLKKIFAQASDDYLQKVANELNGNLAAYGLDNVLRRAHFIAQVRQEGGAKLQANVESLQYSPEGLKNTFKYYRNHPDEAVTDGYEKDAKTRKITRAADQKAIANKAYANRDNGNGNVASGDGWNYRGRGLIQVTGRGNYADINAQYAKLYPNDAVDFVKKPELMAEYPYTIRSAVCFWIFHGLHKLADKGSKDADVDRITAIVNKNTHSYKERCAHFKVAHEAFK